MKNLKYVVVFLISFLFLGNVVNAATLPDSFVTDSIYDKDHKLIEIYLDHDQYKKFPVIRKSYDGKTFVYCMNLKSPLAEGADGLSYAGGLTYKKQTALDAGYTYIAKNRPRTSDTNRDFYITQMAVWYYGDFLNQNNNNIPSAVKKYIIAHKDTDAVSKAIYDLYYGAKTAIAPIQSLTINAEDVTFKKDGEDYVSSEIIIDYQNIGNIKYELANAPDGAKIEKSKYGVIIRVPVKSVTSNVTFKLNVKGDYKKEASYYYFSSDKYQKLLHSEIVTTTETLKADKTMSIKVEKFGVKISKTDITQSKEVEGATLVIKDYNGNVIDTWVSTKDTHYLELVSGKYYLSETIAPKGYKLSTTTLEFLLDENGVVYAKVNGEYVTVDKINFINELIDVVTINKIDKDTKKLVAGAKLVIKDQKGNVVKEFTTTNESYKIELESGYYSLSEISAPNGYVLSNEVIYFYLAEDGTLKIKNESGKYVESASVTFVNTKKVEKEVIVPATGLNSYTLIIGAVLLVSGIVCVKKYSKEY